MDWTATDVAKLTGWKAQSVTHWCRSGLLASRSARTALIKDQTVCLNRLSGAQNKLVKAQLKANMRQRKNNFLDLMAN